MHVKYLQHQQMGTVQLLTMPPESGPATAATSTTNALISKDFKCPENESDAFGEHEPVPLPIQMFLWRQTNHFLGAKVGKLYEASCVTFERIVVQNILYGLSPSLSSAFTTISRWRFVRASFPHIVQCCASLLNERLNEDESLPMSGSLAKMLYILHWLLLDASAECNENIGVSSTEDSGSGTSGLTPICLRQLTYPIFSIQTFVYLLAPLFHTIKEKKIAGHIRLQTGLRIWQALWQQRLPDILCFCAPVKQRRTQSSLIGASLWPGNKVTTTVTAEDAGIYLGDEPPNRSSTRRTTHSTCRETPVGTKVDVKKAGQANMAIPAVTPPPKPPRTDLRVLKELHENRQQPASLEVEQTAQSSQTSENSVLSTCSVVRSVSEYHTFASADSQRRHRAENLIKRSRTEIFDAQSPDLGEDESSAIRRMDTLHFKEDSGSSFSEIFHMSDRAPLASLHEICSSTSADTASHFSCESQQQSAGAFSKNIDISGKERIYHVDNNSVPQSLTFTKIYTFEDSSSVASQQTIIKRRSSVQKTISSQDMETTPTTPIVQSRTELSAPIADSSATLTVAPITGPGLAQQFKSISLTHSDKVELAAADPREATYLDVATIRCLLIRNWSEEGVHWATKYLHNRLVDIRNHQQTLSETSLRSRSNSIPIFNPLKSVRRENSLECSTWTDLRDKMDALDARLGSIVTPTTKTNTKAQTRDAKVSFDELKTELPKRNRLSAAIGDASSRRVSVNTLPLPLHRVSHSSGVPVLSKMSRSQSEPPPLHNVTGNAVLSQLASTRDSECALMGSLASVNAPASTDNDFFPEAIGCARFIERTGHLSLSALLKTLSSLVDGGTTVRVLELVLSICDNLLIIAAKGGAGDEPTLFFDSIVSIIFRTYLHLGCSHGCNEGIRTAQADFLRVKLRALLTQMNKIGAARLAEILRNHVQITAYNQLLDCLHAMTSFCQDGDVRERGGCQRCPSTLSERGSGITQREPSYNNNFNDTHSGIEGVLLSTLLTPLISKLMAEMHNFSLPENMSICQDVRLFVAYVQKYYGNPLRIAALSALRGEFSTAEPVNETTDSSRKHSGARSSNTVDFTNGGRLAPDGNGSISSYSRDNVSLRRGLFKRKEKVENSVATGASNSTVAAADEDSDSGGPGGGAALASDLSGGVGSVGGGAGSALGSSPSTPRNVASSIDETLSNIGSPLLVQQAAKKRAVTVGSGGKLQFALNLLKSVRNDISVDEPWDETANANPDDESINGSGANVAGADENDSLTLADATRARISFRNVNRRPSNYRHRTFTAVTSDSNPELLTSTTAADKSVSDMTQSTSSTTAAVAAGVQQTPMLPHLPPRKLLALKDIREGARRFAFLLELSNPGEFPDVPLIGALPELRSPVLSRAVLLLECVHFVHRCNHGDWPEWVRFGGGGAAFMPSSMKLRGRSAAAANTISSVAFSNTSSGGTSTFAIGRGGSRRAFFMQRAAGRAFYAWAMQLAVSLQNHVDIDDKNDEKRKSEDTDRRTRKLMDDLEDFLDDGTVNDATGEHCPPALQLMVCMLLMQITAFMRETFQTLPRSRASQKNANPQSWEKLMSHRRWSILSNTFNQQTGSIHSINDLHPAIPLFSAERRVSYSTADEESSPRGSYDMLEDPSISTSTSANEKKIGRLAGRRLLKRNVVQQFTNQQQQTQQQFSQQHQQQQAAGERRRDSVKLRKVSRLHTSGGTEASAPFGLAMDDSASAAATRLRPGENMSNATPGTFGISRTQRQSPSPLGSVALTDFQHFSPEKRQPATGTGASPMAYSLEDEEEDMMRNLPWISTLVTFANRFDFTCTHEPICQRWCFERVHRQCRRLTEALKIVYEVGTGSGGGGMPIPADKCFDRRRQYINTWRSYVETVKLKRMSNPRRESATVRQSGVDRMPMALRGLLIEKLTEIEELRAAERKEAAENEDANINSAELFTRTTSMQHFIRTQLHNVVHAPMSGALKGAIAMNHEHYRAMLNVSWNLLTHTDAHVVCTAAASFICCAVKCAKECIEVMRQHMTSPDPNVRAKSICRFFALWKNRYHVWLKMEDNAQMIFKVPPPVIDFTSPSPPIGQSQLPVIDPPWMPYMKTKVEELTLKEEEHSTSQTIMTMTRTRRKQKQEMVKRAVREAEERQSELRRQYLLRCTPVVQLAAYEPALFYQQHIVVQQQQQNQQQDQQQEQQLLDENDFLAFQQNLTANSNDFSQQQQQQPQMTQQQGQTQQQSAQSSQQTAAATSVPQPQLRQQSVLPVAQPLLPSSILSTVPLIIEMFDDTQIDEHGSAVGDVCRKVSWNCIIEDCSLFLRNFLEKLTDQSKQEYLMSLLRKLILVIRPLPSQMAYTLLNYLFGFIMYYVRSPCDGSDRAISLALSLTWLVAPYVHSLYFKDLKQTLKKEQCDQAIMITANVPAAKKVIVHGPDSVSGGIPSQFPIQEDTQFQQILTDSLEFFNIPEEDIEHYFLIDSKTGTFHNPASYARDFYFFHRSFYPQLTLLKVDSEVGQAKIRESAFQQKFIEVGKCLLTHSALKYSNIPQRIFFLHDEFTHLPSFPRRSLESCFGMYQGTMGAELQAMDSVHKFVWNTLISDMFEKMENAFMFGDLHLFINVINGIMIIHCEDILILRRCMATYITMTIHFSTLFASQGFFLIMPTILRCYSQRQTNRMFTQVVEFVCKQFYILHRKPFLLQMFGSVADICDLSVNDLEINAMQVKAKYLFGLLLAMENMNDLVDNIDILSLVAYPKPLKALDLCYKEDPNSFMILTDGIASCVTVCAFAPESKRSYQMLLIMQAIMPYLLKHLEEESTRQGNSAAAIKHETTAYTTMCVEMRTLVNSCESLSRGPTRSFDIGLGVSDRGKSFIADSPQFFDPPTINEDEAKPSYYNNSREKKLTDPDGMMDNSEIQKEIFRGPRNSLLNLTTFFIVRAGVRLKELSKLASSSSEHAIRIPEIFDHRCHARLSEVAISLLKIAPYDLTTLACTGLQKFFLRVLPIVDWSVESNRSVLNVILRRLDKTIVKVAKKPSIRRRANWQAIGTWLDGLYQTLTLYPYIAHLHPLKTITQMCLRLIIGEQCNDDSTSSNQLINQINSTILSATIPPTAFCNSVLKLTAFLMQALGQSAFSLEYICSADTLCQLSDCAEAVLCHILMPLFIRAAVPGKEVTQFQAKDIVFSLNFMHNAICPPLAKQSLPPVSNPATFTRDTSGRQGSVSITDRGYSATVSTLRIVRDSVVQSVLLMLKIMIVTFQKQMTAHWVKVAKILKELISKKAGGPALISFIHFLVNVNLPISLIIKPLIHNKLNQRYTNEQDINWQNELRDALIAGEKTREPLEAITASSPSNVPNKISGTALRGSFCLLSTLSRELQVMKEDFCTRVIEHPHVHTPILGDLHSESGSSVSTSMHRAATANTAGTNESRRLSSSAALAKLRSVTSSAAKAAFLTSAANVTSLASVDTGAPATDSSAIPECTEDELSSSSRTPITSSDTTTKKMDTIRRSSARSPSRHVGTHSIKFSSTQQRQRSIVSPTYSGSGNTTSSMSASLVRGMFQSIRRNQPRPFFGHTEQSQYQRQKQHMRTTIEMPDLTSHHRRSKSLNKKRSHIVEDPVIVTPLVTAQTKTDLSHLPTHSSMSSRTLNAGDSQHGSSLTDNDRPRVVSFSTPKKSVSSYDTSDSEDVYYITARHHAI